MNKSRASLCPHVTYSLEEENGRKQVNILPNMMEFLKRPQRADLQSRVDLERQSGQQWKRDDGVTSWKGLQSQTSPCQP